MSDIKKLIKNVEKAQKESGLSDGSMKKAIRYLKDLKNLSEEDKAKEVEVYRKCIQDTIKDELDPYRDIERAEEDEKAEEWKKADEKE